MACTLESAHLLVSKRSLPLFLSLPLLCLELIRNAIGIV